MTKDELRKSRHEYFKKKRESEYMRRKRYINETIVGAREVMNDADYSSMIIDVINRYVTLDKVI